jgi:transcriptional regulator with XRE-family HTH domain
LADNLARLRGSRPQREIAEEVGVTTRHYRSLEAGKDASLELLRKLAALHSVSVASLLADPRDIPSTAERGGPSTKVQTIPLSGEVVPEGIVQSEALTELITAGFYRAAPDAFTYPDRVAVDGAGPRWFAITVEVECDPPLQKGDMLIMAPVADRAPRTGDIVIATIELDDEQLQKTRLRQLRDVDGRQWLWPMSPQTGDRPSMVCEGWEIVAIVVELRRRHLAPRQEEAS